MTGRQRVLALIRGEKPDHLPFMPITMQFASRLIGKPYRQYATDYRVLAEGQLAVAEKFHADHVSVISDPTREAEACGAEILWEEDATPAIDEERAVLADIAAFSSLKVPDPAAAPRMLDRLKAVELLKERVGDELLVEGWIEGPCAEGADLRGISRLMVDFFDEPGFVKELFSFVYEMEMRFAKAQLEAGADIIGIGDAAASLVGPELYDEFVLPVEKKLVDGIHASGGMVRLHICGNTSRMVASMASLGCEIVDLDYPDDMAEARKAAGPEQILLGNIEPVGVLRDGSPELVTEALEACARAAAPRWIVSAGCEITADTPHRNVLAMAEFARNWDFSSMV